MSVWKPRFFACAIPIVFLSGGAGPFASFPEPDLVIYGRLGGVAASRICAVWPQGSACAASAGTGHYVLRVPVDDATTGAAGGRATAARFGDEIAVQVDGQTVERFQARVRGQIERFDLGASGPFRRGDSNSSGGQGDKQAVDISDAVFTLGCLFLGTACPSCPDAADANDDKSVDISDAVFTLGFLFLGGPPPPDPGPFACGVDPTDDPLSPCFQPACDVAGGAGGIARGPEEAQGGGGGGGGGRAPAEAAALAAGTPGVAPGIASSSRGRGWPEGTLRVLQERVDFGAVPPGTESTKTVILRNAGPDEVVLEAVQATDGAFASLPPAFAVPPGGTFCLGVRFRPVSPGHHAAVLVLAPGDLVELEGDGASGSPAARIHDVLVAPLDWARGQEISVPVTFQGWPRGATVDYAIECPGGDLSLRGLHRPKDLPPSDAAREAPQGEGSSGSLAGSLLLDEEETGCIAYLLVGPRKPVEDARAPPALACPLIWTRLRASQGATTTDGAGAHGELVVADALIDLDGDGRLSVSSDLVYAARGLEGLPAVPQRFPPLAELDAAALERRLAALVSCLPGTRSDLDPLAERLLGLAPANTLARSTSAFLAFAVRPYTRPRRELAVSDPGPWPDVDLRLEPPRPGRSDAALMLSASQDISALALTLELSDPGPALVFEPDAGLARLRVFAGRVAEGGGRAWRLALLDPLGESWIPAGSLRLGYLSWAPERALRVPEEVALSIRDALAARGARELPVGAGHAVVTLHCSRPAALRQAGDCDGDGRLGPADAMHLARLLLTPEGEAPEAEACDFDGDGALDLLDVCAAARRLFAPDRREP
ncbi:MAG: hypothetical protein HY721_29085 [Planctomycetes bacterium]|nr:hypothetical protein [Planctomycetota bacterium]